jgi:trypsin
VAKYILRSKSSVTKLKDQLPVLDLHFHYSLRSIMKPTIPAIVLLSLAFKFLPVNAIAGGKVVGYISSVPYTVSISQAVLGGQQHACGGSILNDNTIITTADCVNDLTASQIQIRTGSLHHASGGKLHKVKTVKKHEQYDSTTGDNNLAVLIVSTPIIFGNGAEAIELVAQGHDLAPGGTVKLSGWGATTSITGTLNAFEAQMHSVEVPSIARAECKAMLGPGSTITSQEVCDGAPGGGKGGCRGDTGGPIVQEGKLLGLITIKSACESDRPEIGTRIGQFVDWITKNKD